MKIAIYIVMLPKYAASKDIYLQRWILPTCTFKFICLSEPEGQFEEQNYVYLQSRVYLQNQQQYSCTVSNTLRAEPKAVSITGPDARILSNTILTWIEICGIRFKESPQAPKVDAGSFFQSTSSLLRNVQYHIP
jgi:hypothetical protein